MDSDSSTDDDTYINAAARFKAMKKKTPIIYQDSPKTNEEDSDCDVWSPKTLEPPSPELVIPESVVTPTSTCSSRSRSQRNTLRNMRSSTECPSSAIVIPDDEDEVIAINDSVIRNNSLDLNCTAELMKDIDDDKYPVEVKIRWRSTEMYRLELRKYEPFQRIFQYFAQLEGILENQILIFKKDKQLRSTDTPASVDLRVIDILDGGVVDTPVKFHEQTEDTENMCKIKVQMSTKQKIVVNLKMDETFKTVLMTCAEKLSVAPSRIKLSFDGDEITPEDTPESLDLEQEACIDLRVSAS